MSELIDPIEKKRVRWRSRRGLLELDLVLTRFLAERYDQLTPDEFAAYVRILDLPDTEFLELVNGKVETDDVTLAPIVAMLRSV
ncbi:MULTISPECIES: succinate dehydrogenase assembly factor 2 [Craterilacuibacter]|uniref:FAD assembly factor SdhE n=1 Tax=Craterilacuibacter sinensis TaxID=2686017 RepID=A0A845BK82_9NEIS|nr:MULTISPECIES: succinate dehydrogenase assembly factor 2 [Craterilacuibacter]MCL6262077.1 succinate dehydrogenase assembly factor 2 [Craterilacuibacter sp. RT1T]MCP9758082.1 succinate dehydrogenase assembly factor 2 family protein [Aquitalea sp. S1-19]MXR35684.1 succinate dehydrogenase assembly factor 2 family protein [Craterilacuibacter sinensis]RQW29485.1 succinate dehydrogenase assembly factor 2 family protein [Rhodobacteraceae bacterium CH30]